MSWHRLKLPSRLAIVSALLLTGCSPDKWYQSKERIQYALLERDSEVVDTEIARALAFVEERPVDVRRALKAAGFVQGNGRVARDDASCEEWLMHIVRGDKRNPPGLDVAVSYCEHSLAGQRIRVISKMGTVL
jgi:hypothetical protein